ncbi:formin-like protein 3 isoform X2 [Cygnus olor]|uniref:formin-like protein 3 isoform X2 n=1 Tax=Cygnus olor TaxID=8869 RepID=UPI001ADE9E8F|nr:formin-like protein 3 isoform X2 [Cygnus olor]
MVLSGAFLPSPPPAPTAPAPPRPPALRGGEGGRGEAHGPRWGGGHGDPTGWRAAGTGFKTCRRRGKGEAAGSGRRELPAAGRRTGAVGPLGRVRPVPPPSPPGGSRPFPSLPLPSLPLPPPLPSPPPRTSNAGGGPAALRAPPPGTWHRPPVLVLSRGSGWGAPRGGRGERCPPPGGPLSAAGARWARPLGERSRETESWGWKSGHPTAHAHVLGGEGAVSSHSHVPLRAQHAQDSEGLQPETQRGCTQPLALKDGDLPCARNILFSASAFPVDWAAFFLVADQEGELQGSSPLHMTSSSLASAFFPTAICKLRQQWQSLT